MVVMGENGLGHESAGGHRALGRAPHRLEESAKGGALEVAQGGHLRRICFIALIAMS